LRGGSRHVGSARVGALGVGFAGPVEEEAFEPVHELGRVEERHERVQSSEEDVDLGRTKRREKISSSRSTRCPPVRSSLSLSLFETSTDER